MFSDTDMVALYFERKEKIVILTEIKSIFLLAQQHTEKDLEKQYPTLTELKEKLSIHYTECGATQDRQITCAFYVLVITKVDCCRRHTHKHSLGVL